MSGTEPRPKAVKRYAVVRETWTVIVHDYSDGDDDHSQFFWEENHCSENEARKIADTMTRFLEKNNEHGICNLCSVHEAKLLGVYDTIEAAQAAHHAVPIEDEDYEEPDGSGR